MTDWLIDTNVISETIKPKPQHQVLRWISDQRHVLIAAVTVYEIASGIARVPGGKRHRLLEAWLGALLAGETEVVPLDRDAALEAVALEVVGRRTGRSFERRDLFILATARARSCGVATRNMDHFRGFGVPAYDPFTDEYTT